MIRFSVFILSYYFKTQMPENFNRFIIELVCISLYKLGIFRNYARQISVKLTKSTRSLISITKLYLLHHEQAIINKILEKSCQFVAVIYKQYPPRLFIESGRYTRQPKRQILFVGIACRGNFAHIGV